MLLILILSFSWEVALKGAIGILKHSVTILVLQEFLQAINFHFTWTTGNKPTNLHSSTSYKFVAASHFNILSTMWEKIPIFASSHEANGWSSVTYKLSLPVESGHWAIFEPYLSVNGYSALNVFVLGFLCSSSFLSFLSCNLSTSDLIPPGVRVLR